MLKIILSCLNFTLIFTRNRNNYKRKWVWKKRRALCHYRDTTFYILTDALVLVCRYFVRYTISSAKHRVPCDKNKGQELLPTAIRLVAGRGCTWCTEAVYRG